MASDSTPEDVYCDHHGVLCYESDLGPQCPLCPAIGRPPKPEAVELEGPDMRDLIAEFCNDRVDHHQLIEAAARRGLRWGSGVLSHGDSRVTVEMGHDQDPILVFETARGAPGFLLVVREDIYWTEDLNRAFRPASGDKPSSVVKGSKARTRVPATGSRTAPDTFAVSELGIVELFEPPSQVRTKIQRDSPLETVDSLALDPAAPTPTVEIPTKKSAIPWMLAGAVALIGVIAYSSYNSFNSRIDRAITANDIFGPQGAVTIYRQAKAKNAQSPDLATASGKISARLGPFADNAYQKWYKESEPPDWPLVAQTYEFLSEIDPANAEYVARKAYAQGQVAFEERRFQAAFNLYDEALRAKPGWVLAINGKAKVYIRNDSPLSDGQKGEQAFLEAIRSDPNFVWAYKNLGEYYKQQSNWAEAVNYLSQAAQIAPDRASIVTSLNDARRRLDQQQARARRRR